MKKRSGNRTLHEARLARTLWQASRTPRVLLHLLLAGALLGPGCSQSVRHAGNDPPDRVSYLVVMSAYPPELSRLLEAATLRDTVVVNGITCNIGTLAAVSATYD